MRTTRLRATLAAFVAVLATASVAAAPAGAGTTAEKPTPTTTTVLGDNPAAGAFYQPPNPLPKAKPGTIIRSEALTNAPAGSLGWRILYHSTGLHGEDIAVSGMVFAPAADSARAVHVDDRRHVRGREGGGWSHHRGLGPPDHGRRRPARAPSVLPDGPTLVAGLQSFLDAGFVVAATDYQGLGTPGVHPYLVGISEGRGTLNAAPRPAT